MKKGILLLLTMLLLVSTTEANNGERSNFRMGYTSEYDAPPIQFKERGIKFYIFLNGEFDFDTQRRRGRTIDYAHRTSRRDTRARMQRGVRIERDYRGRIRRVGNVFINYNRRGKVSRIGNIFIKYKHRQVSKVGGLKVLRNYWGDVRYIGKVKRNFHDFYWNDWDMWEYDFDDDFFYRRDFDIDFEAFDEDDNFLYYRPKKETLKSGELNKVIKRKKNVKSPKKTRRATH